MGDHLGSLNWNPILKGFPFSNTDHIMENQETGQTDDRITKLVRVLDQILPLVGYSPNPLRVEDIDEVREDQLSDLNTPPPLKAHCMNCMNMPCRPFFQVHTCMMDLYLCTWMT